MSKNNFEVEKLSKKERRKFFRQLQAKMQHRERRKSLLLKVMLIVITIGIVGGLVYLFATSKPAGQNGSSTSLNSIGNLKLGDQAPDFSLPATNGKTVSLKDYQGKNVLLYFQEGVMCQPCWKQIGSMQKNSDLFNQIGTEIVTIGVDSASTWGPILKAEGVTTIPVLIDDDRIVSGAYGVLSMPSQMHSDRPGHTFILVDKDGKIAWIGDYPTMRVTDEEILNSIKQSLKL